MEAAAAARLSGIVRVNKSAVEQVCQDALQSSANECLRILFIALCNSSRSGKLGTGIEMP